MTAEKNAPLAGKVFIVSGASKRLGRCYVMSLAKAGAHVVALARTMGDDPAQFGTLAEVEASGRALGLKVTARRCDLQDEDSIRGIVEETARELGGVDGLVNNAVYGSGGRMKDRGVARADWEGAFAINVRAPYVLIDAARSHMEARGGGSVVNITSLAAAKPAKGGGAHRGLMLYGLTKAALNRLTTWYAAELESNNIAVNAISPGDVSIYMSLANGIAADEPDREVVGPEQMDEAFWGDPVAWLAGARPADVTGEILHTYTFGETWGPRRETPQWSPIIQKILGRDNMKPR
jgi:NAD(P)-dependent dehydrogenase (short-subunit alcohol dehydrogenase family)